MILELFKKGKANNDAESPLPSLESPFKRGYIDGLCVNMSTNAFNGNVWFWGSVTFKNGRTTAKQEFRGESFLDVCQQMDAFLKSITL